MFVVAKDKKDSNKEYVKQCLNDIVDIIKDNAPFPVDTFTIDIEHHVDYVMWPFSLEPVIDEVTGEKKKIKNRLVKERKGKKKNYLLIYENGKGEIKTEITGLPIKKVNATPLGMKIFKEILEPEIIKMKSAKFSKKHIDSIVEEFLKDKEILKLLAVEHRVKAVNTYKKSSQIQAQISSGYFNGKEGIISLIKNKSVGKAGLGAKYCTVKKLYLTICP